MDTRKLGLIMIPVFMLPVVGILVVGAIFAAAVPDARGALLVIVIPLIAFSMFVGVAGLFVYVLIYTFKKRGIVVGGKPVDLAAISEVLRSDSAGDVEQPAEVQRLLAEIEAERQRAPIVRSPERRAAARQSSGIATGIIIALMIAGLALGRAWYEVFGLGAVALLVILMWCATEGGFHRDAGPT